MRRGVLLLTAAFGACAAGPRPLVVGEDQCTHCHMTVADPRFGAEVVTATGRVLVYDAIECLVEGLGTVEGEIQSVWVTDFEAPGTLIPASEAFFLQSDRLRSPMGAGLAAFASPAGRDLVRVSAGGTPLTWEEVRARG